MSSPAFKDTPPTLEQIRAQIKLAPSTLEQIKSTPPTLEQIRAQTNQLLEMVQAASRTYESLSSQVAAAAVPWSATAFAATVAAAEALRKSEASKAAVLVAARRVKAQAEERAKRFGGRSVEALIEILLSKSRLLPADPGHPPLNQTQVLLAAALLRRSRDGWPTVALGTLVDEVGVKTRMLRNAMGVLEDRGFVTRIDVKGRPNLYDLSGLVAHLCDLVSGVAP